MFFEKDGGGCITFLPQIPNVHKQNEQRLARYIDALNLPSFLLRDEEEEASDDEEDMGIKLGESK